MQLPFGKIGGYLVVGVAAYLAYGVIKAKFFAPKTTA